MLEIVKDPSSLEQNRAVGSGNFIAADFNPLNSQQESVSAVGTAYESRLCRLAGYTMVRFLQYPLTKHSGSWSLQDCRIHLRPIPGIDFTILLYGSPSGLTGNHL